VAGSGALVVEGFEARQYLAGQLLLGVLVILLIRTRVDKWGFPVPQGKWISGAWYKLLQEFLDSREMRERGIYNLPEIRRDLELHRQGTVDVSGRLFSLVQIELWSRQQRFPERLVT
jgi:hypothetical protein